MSGCSDVIRLPLACTTLLVADFVLAEEGPFSENRVRDFYRCQAEHYLNRQDQIPSILPPFLYFDVPEASGEYPYVCMSPGHWQVTRGMLIVTE